MRGCGTGAAMQVPVGEELLGRVIMVWATDEYTVLKKKSPGSTTQETFRTHSIALIEDTFETGIRATIHYPIGVANAWVFSGSGVGSPRCSMMASR